MKGFISFHFEFSQLRNVPKGNIKYKRMGYNEGTLKKIFWTDCGVFFKDDNIECFFSFSLPENDSLNAKKICLTYFRQALPRKIIFQEKSKYFYNTNFKIRNSNMARKVLPAKFKDFLGISKASNKTAIKISPWQNRPRRNTSLTYESCWKLKDKKVKWRLWEKPIVSRSKSSAAAQDGLHLWSLITGLSSKIKRVCWRFNRVLCNEVIHSSFRQHRQPTIDNHNTHPHPWRNWGKHKRVLWELSGYVEHVLRRELGKYPSIDRCYFISLLSFNYNHFCLLWKKCKIKRKKKMMKNKTWRKETVMISN